MIDLHIHFLPGVDDGPSDLDEAVQMCLTAAADGCTHLVATPHQRCERWVNTDPDDLSRRLDDVRARVASEIELSLGAEIRVDHGFLDDVQAMPGSGLLPLAGTRYLLVEFDRYGLGPEPEAVLDELFAADWKPIIAHPEFVPQFVETPDRLRDVVAAGATTQITAASVLGRFGRGPERFTHRLLDDGLAGILASDGHGLRWRPPGIAEARRVIGRRWGETAAEELTAGRPAAILRDEPPDR